MSQSTASAISVVQAIDSVPHILKLVAESTEVGFVCVAHVTENSWTACAVYDLIDFNMEIGDHLEITETLCERVRAKNQKVVIEHATNDPVYCDNSVPKQYGFQSYFSYPLYDADGTFFGTLCGLDKKPLTLKTDKLNSMISSFASLLSRQIADAATRVATEKELRSQREAVALREQNIAILGHDIRTPLSSISMGLDVIEHHVREPQVAKILKIMRASTLRISRLISDVMDFAHTRVGHGVKISLSESDNLGSRLAHIVSELQNSYPTAEIVSEIDIREKVYCDDERLSQLFSNLLINALIHGDLSQPVKTEACVEDATLRIEVTNHGPTIRKDALAKLFEPFWRLDQEKTGEGLGLGLFIASEISKAHDADLSVKSTEGVTRFTLTMPVRPAS